MALIKIMDHTEYAKVLKSKTVDQLRYIRQDAYNAAMAMPDGPNHGYYLDEVHYCSMELKRRETSR